MKKNALNFANLYFGFRFFLQIAIFLLGANAGKAQEVMFEDCAQREIKFEGEVLPTLCSQYENVGFDYEVGVGSPQNILSSQQLGAVPPGSNILIVGNFLVNTSFTFENAIVKIAPGTTVCVTNNLSVVNSKLFACCIFRSV